jgi:5,10-methylenetetrahydrofolate reductase
MIEFINLGNNMHSVYAEYDNDLTIYGLIRVGDIPIHNGQVIIDSIGLACMQKSTVPSKIYAEIQDAFSQDLLDEIEQKKLDIYDQYHDR